jgi:inosose dehydratase
VLDEMVQAGYDGTELGPYGFLPTEPAHLKEELAQRGLALLGAFVPLPLATAERHEIGFQEAIKTADLLANSGAPFMVLADEMSDARMAVGGRASESDGMTSEQWREAAKLLARTAKECTRRRLRPVFHHHVGTFIETPAELDLLCAVTDPELLGICLDTGHYYYGGGDPVEAVRRYGKRIQHLHFKDVSPATLELVRHEKVPYLDAVRRGVFCELGEGAVDLRKVVEQLSQTDFEGWAVVEQDVDTTNPNVRPLESAHRSRQYLRNTIKI